MSKYYITTPIYYVNDLPHIGHIYTTLVADTVARYRRLEGDDVYFLTGTDEHGQKIEKTAAEQGVEPIALANRVVERYHQLWKQLEITHDDFIRTTEPRHRAGVEKIVARIAEKGDLYVDRHEGFYCVRCETFYTDKELLDGDRCPIHETPCDRQSEENVFFRLSKYQDALLAHYEAHPSFVQPESRLNEVKQFVAQGLKDLSVSRTTVDWGIPLPGFEGHTIYVWLDALTNYISALGFGSDSDQLYQDLWQGDGTRIHLVGKDILRFHAVFWPAFLLAADLPLPTTVWAHGWWLRDDLKMSKSIGNVVRPDNLLEDFGHEALRYYVLRDMAFGQDAAFSDEAFIDRYNSDLANDIGNTLSRLVTLSRRAFDGTLPPKKGDGLKEAAERAMAEYRSHMESFSFHEALRCLSKLNQEISQFLVQNEPWKKLKDDSLKEEVSEILWAGLEALRLAATALIPILPEKAPKILTSIGADVPETFTDGALSWGGLGTGSTLGGVEPLFPRIDKKDYLAELAAADPKETKKPQPQEKKGKKEPKGDAAKTGQATEGLISIDDFFNVMLKVATVRSAERVPKSDKLLRLSLDAGEESERTVVAGLGKAYEPEALVDRQVIVVANLKPAKLMGVESNGMVLAATADGKPVLLGPESEVPAGTRVK